MKTKKLLPFAWIRKKRMFSNKRKERDRARRDFDAFERGLRALIKRFGYQQVLRGFIDVACDQSILSLQTEIHGADGVLYREAFTLLDHAEKTLNTIVHLRREKP